MVFKVKSYKVILLSAILTEIYSFSNMMKPNLCKNNIILGSPTKRETHGKENVPFLVTVGNKRRNQY